MIPSMNKITLVAAVALVFASAFIMISSGSIQSAHACPNKSGGAAAQNVNPATPSNLNAQLLPNPSSLVAGQTA